MTAPRKPRTAAKKKPRTAAKKQPRKTAGKKAVATKAVTKKGARKKAPAKKAVKKAKKAGRKAPSKKAAGATARKAAKKAAPKKAPAGKSVPKAKTNKTKKNTAPRKRKFTPAQRTLALVEKVLDEHQADDVAVVDISGKTAMADYMVVASGRNPRHIGAMADHLKRQLKAPGGRPPPVEGSGGTDWVLVDAGDVIVHLFRPEVRDLYNLEKMWGPEWTGEPEDL